MPAILSGTQFIAVNANKDLTGKKSKRQNEVEKVYTIKDLASEFPPVFAKGDVTGATNIDFLSGNVQSMRLIGNATLTFSNPQNGATYRLIINQDATGTRTITWPVIHWEAKTVPILTGTAGSKDIVELVYDGTNYNGRITKNYGV